MLNSSDLENVAKYVEKHALLRQIQNFQLVGKVLSGVGQVTVD